MIFKRRKKQSIPSILRNIIWPKMGWKRTIIYYKHRILRLPHSAHDIALGMASGCVVSWTPTFPFHIAQCFIFCRILRANFPAALLGSVFGNPWTFPLLFTISYLVGNFILDITGFDEALTLWASETSFFKPDGEVIKKFIPTLIGGYIMAIISFPLFYYGFYYLVTAGRASQKAVSNKVHNIIEHRHERRHEKKERKNKEERQL